MINMDEASNTYTSDNTDMEDEPIVPVYLICGFLESGKTTLINRMIENDSFAGMLPVVISCEEGVEELDRKRMKAIGAETISLDVPEKLDGKFLQDLNDNYDPECVVIEYNTMWTLKRFIDIELPKYWQIIEIVSLIDAGTYDNYMTNMRQYMTEAPMIADMIIVNRSSEKTPKSAIRRQLKAVNPRARIMFENLDGTHDDGVSDEDLPYDMKAEVIDIPDDMFGTFFLDGVDHAKRYQNRTVRLSGLVCSMDDPGEKGYYIGRKALVCCANDVRIVGLPVKTKTKRPRFGEWISLTAKCDIDYVPFLGRDGVVLTQISAEKAKAPEDEVIDLTK